MRYFVHRVEFTQLIGKIFLSKNIPSVTSGVTNAKQNKPRNRDKKQKIGDSDEMTNKTKNRETNFQSEDKKWT